MNRPPPCEWCGRRPLSPGGKKLRAYLQEIWDAPTPWEIEQTAPEIRQKPGRPRKGENVGISNISGNGTTTPYLAARLKRDHPDIAAASEGHARARGVTSKYHFDLCLRHGHHARERGE